VSWLFLSCGFRAADQARVECLSCQGGFGQLLSFATDCFAAVHLAPIRAALNRDRDNSHEVSPRVPTLHLGRCWANSTAAGQSCQSWARGLWHVCRQEPRSRVAGNTAPKGM
jgi:hypothetical protein